MPTGEHHGVRGRNSLGTLNGTTLKYVQVAAQLRADILSRKSQAAPYKLPPYQELMRRYDVSLSTLRQALDVLKDEGLIETRRGSGTYAFPEKSADDTERGRRKIQFGRLNVILPDEGLTDPSRNPQNWFMAQDYLRGICDEAQALGIPINLVTIPDTPDPHVEVNPHSPPALIYPHPGLSLRLIDALAARGCHNVCLIHPPMGSAKTLEIPAYCVTVETEAASYEAVSTLLQTRSRVAFLRAPRDNPYHQGRMRGYQRALADAGCTFRPELVRECSGTVEAGYLAMQELLRMRERPDAVFAATDVRAYGAIRAIQEWGLSIPDDIAIAGFDDLPQSARMEPPLASVWFPRIESGREAVRIAQRLLRGETDVPRLVTLHAHYVSRESDGSRRR